MKKKGKTRQSHPHPHPHPRDREERKVSQSTQVSQECLVLGRRPAGVLLKNSQTRIREIVVASGAKFPPEFEEFLNLPQFSKILREVSRDALDQLAQRGSGGDGAHQGVLVVVEPQMPLELSDLIDRALESGESPTIVILDQIVDPQNLGAVLRVCEASGVAGVISTIDRSAPLSPVARKASAGASEVVPVCFVNNLQRAIEKLRERGFWIYGTSLAENSVSLYRKDIDYPAAFVFGNEGRGIRSLTAKLCDHLVSIPLSGVIESINVSQAASIVLFEALRRRISQ